MIIKLIMIFNIQKYVKVGAWVVAVADHNTVKEVYGNQIDKKFDSSI